MSEEAIVQNMISRLGQSQHERPARELDPHFADVDERGPVALLRFARAFAAAVRFHAVPGTTNSGDDWTPFFDLTEAQAAALLRQFAGDVPPHLALFATFARLHEFPRAHLNALTARHLDFHYRRVLRFEPRPAVPDRAHVLVELKKGAPAVRIGPEHLLSAGKDAAGELLYAPTADTIVSLATVESLRSLFVDRRGSGTVRAAAVANSADGFGAPLDPAAPRFSGFGGPDLPPAEVGWAVASPVLRLREGQRTVTVSLGLAGGAPGLSGPTPLAGAFRAFLTGAQSWLGPFAVIATITGDRAECRIDLPADTAAVVDYSAAVHGYAYWAQAPVLQMQLEPGAPVGYTALAGLTVQSVEIRVDVSGITTLELESDAGTLDSKKAFLPFGPQPAAGASFLVGCPEALDKNLSAMALTLTWQAPPNFAQHYKDYGVTGVGDTYFTAGVSFQDGGSWQVRRTGVPLFSPRNASGQTEIRFDRAASASPVRTTASTAAHVSALSRTGGSWSTKAATRLVRINPVFRAFLGTAPPVTTGFIAFTLDRDFLHARFRQKSVELLVAHATSPATSPLVVLPDPYTPTLRSLSLSYTAHSATAQIGTATLAEFSQPDVQFFHVGPFGQRREHAYQREQLPFVADRRVPLLPRYDAEGALLVGVSGLQARGSVSLLCQVAEGSANPDLARQPVSWSVLCDNYWKPLGPGELVRDTTGGLLTSGILSIVVPGEATTANTMMPPGPIWLKGEVAVVDAVSQLVEVAANAVEVRWVADLDAPAHLASALPAQRIARLKNPVGQVKRVVQPYASFGGAAVEGETALRTRAAERLRHRERAVAAWDIERLVLGAFPKVHTVKAIPHARDGQWLAPGHVLVVVVPDLRNQNAVDPLRPRVDADTLERIRVFLQARSAMGAVIAVKNPNYQQVRIDCRVQFRPGYEFSYYSEQVRQALVRVLSPWAFDATRPIAFGGRVIRSVLLDVVEELPYVDYVTDFRMTVIAADGSAGADLPEVQAATPDAILVSAQAHLIAPVE